MNLHTMKVEQGYHLKGYTPPNDLEYNPLQETHNLTFIPLYGKGIPVVDGFPTSLVLDAANMSSTVMMSYNWSGVEEEVERGALGWIQDLALGSVLSFLCLLTVVGNAMVLHAVRTEKSLQTVSNMYIVSLAVADLTVGLIVMPISAIYIFTETWPFGIVLCQLWIGVDYTASTASIFNLFILSLDRYWSVTSPLKYLRRRTKRRALIMISMVWFLSSLWLIPVIGWHHFVNGGIRTVPNDVCDTEYATNTALKIITGIVNYYLPLAIMYILYGKIFNEIRKRSKLEIGQKNTVKSMRHRDEQNLSASISLSDESDRGVHNGNNSSSRGTSVMYNHVNSEVRVGLNHKVLCRVTENVPEMDSIVETDNTEEELLQPKAKQYTDLTIVRVDKPGYSSSTDILSSDSEYRPRYIYDETVVDSTTEQLKRFFYEEHDLSVFKSKPNEEDEQDNDNDEEVNLCDSKTAETSLSSIPNSPVLLNHYPEKTKDKVRLDVPNVSPKMPHIFPKENHPAKNQYVTKPNRKPPCSSGYLQIPNTSPTHVPNKTNPNNGDLLHRSTSSSFTPTVKPHDPRRSPHMRRATSMKMKPSCHKENGSSHHRSYSFRQGDSALVKQAARLRGKLERKKHRPSSALSKEIKAARQLGVIMGAFTICFFPYFVCFLVVAFCLACVSTDLMIAMTWIGYLNSTLNPVLYPLCNLHFRRKFRKMLNFKTDENNRGYYAQTRLTVQRYNHSYTVDP